MKYYGIGVDSGRAGNQEGTSEGGMAQGAAPIGVGARLRAKQF